MKNLFKNMFYQWVQQFGPRHKMTFKNFRPNSLLVLGKPSTIASVKPTEMANFKKWQHFIY